MSTLMKWSAIFLYKIFEIAIIYCHMNFFHTHIPVLLLNKLNQYFYSNFLNYPFLVYTSFESRNFINSKNARTLLKKYCQQKITEEEYQEMNTAVSVVLLSI